MLSLIKRLASVVAWVAAATFPTFVDAAQPVRPALRVGSGTLITPTAALSYYGTPTSAAPVARDPMVRELARGLNYDIDRIFEHVRDHVVFTPMFGLQKGARGVILDQNGTAFDQAEFLVEMLREADAQAARGYNPRYQYGRITLSAAQFAAWFGVADAASATRVLADGGIPAVVTGSGASFQVEMAHVWVAATVDGATYLFDPAFKPETVAPTFNIAGASGLSAAEILSAGASGAAISTSSVQGYNQGAVRDRLTAYRSSLEAYLQTNAPGTPVGEVLAGRKITPHAQAERRRTSLPYAVSAPDRTWTGRVPDVFRTRLTVQVAGGATATYFADEQYGKTLQIRYPAGPDATPFETTKGNVSGDCDLYGAPGTVSQQVVITVDHPYAAQSGEYMDEVITKPLAGRACAGGAFYLTQEWGLTSHRAGEEQRRQLAASAEEDARSRWLGFGPTLKNVPAQFSSYLALSGQALNAQYQVHHLIGVHHLDSVNQSYQLSSGGSIEQSLAPQLLLTMDYEGAITVNPRGGVDATARAALGRVAAGLLAVSESSVPRQEQDAVREITALTLVTQQDALAPNAGSYPTYVATSANWASVRGQLQGYSSQALTVMDGYIADGYSLFVPQQGQLHQARFSFTQSGVTTTYKLNETGVGPEVTRSAFQVFSPSGSAAVLVFDPRRGRVLKGSVGVAVEAPDGTGLKRPEAPKASRADPVMADISVDGRSGTLSYAPDVDISDGPGEFPRRLDFQRRYDGRDTVDYGFGIGWKTNWLHTVSLNNDGRAASGESDATGAASALVAIRALYDLTSATPDPGRLMAATVAQKWLADQTINNAATVAAGFAPDQRFERLADGRWVSAQPDGARLEQIGEPYDSIDNRRRYTGVGFTYTGRDGDVRRYGRVATDPAPDTSDARILGAASPKSYGVRDWVLADGHRLTFFGVLVPGSFEVRNDMGSFLRVRDYVLGEETPYQYCKPNQPTPTTVDSYPRSFRIENSVGQSASYLGPAARRTGGFPFWTDPPECQVGPGGEVDDDIVGPIVTLRAPLSRFVDPARRRWSYAYVTEADGQRVGGASQYTGGPIQLSEVFKPSLQAGVAQDAAGNTTVGGGANAAAQMSFGLNGVTRSVRNAKGAVFTYYASPYRSEQRNPLGQGRQTFFDDQGRPVAELDELLRRTTTRYDLRGRPLATVRPDGDATEYTYDVRGNRLTETQRGKQGGALTTTFIYPEPGVLLCTTTKICNKPQSEDGPRTDVADVTNYAWNVATGTIAQILRPADADGRRPQLDVGYFVRSGVNGGQLVLPETITQKVDASRSQVTRYTYDANNKFVPLTRQVDPNGLNLVTTFGFNAVGDLTSIKNARTDVDGTENYTWDESRRLIFLISPDPDGAGAQLRPTTAFQYNADGLLEWTIRGTTTSAIGNNFQVITRTQYTYDAAGFLTSEQQAPGTSDGSLTQYGYDAAGRQTCAAMRMNRAVFNALPDACSQSTAGGFGPDLITKTVLDAAGQVSEERRSVGTSLEHAFAAYTYTGNGRTQTVKDGRGSTSTYSYDQYDRLDRLTYPDASYEQTVYDAASNPIQQRTRSGARLLRTYDPLGRKLTETAETPTSMGIKDRTFAYDLLDRMTRADAPNTPQYWTYDQAGRLAEYGANIGAFVNTWDAAGNLTNQTYPDGTRSGYNYDAADRMIGAYHLAPGASVIQGTALFYDAVSRRSAIQFDDRSTQAYAYDGADRITSISHTFPANTADNVTFGYGYDPVGREISRNISNAAYRHAPASTATSYGAADSLNRYPSVGGVAYSWNAQGSLANDGARDYVHDENDRLIWAGRSDLGIGVWTPHSATDRLVFRQTATPSSGDTLTYLMPAGVRPEVLAEQLYTKASGAPAWGAAANRVYIAGPNVDERLMWRETDNVVRYPHTDRQGTTIAISQAGQAVAKFAYGPYGESTALPTPAPGAAAYWWRYTGQRLDPMTGLYDYKARVYSANLGRFLQPDPLRYHEDGPNLYGYVWNDPLNNTDSAGTVCVPCVQRALTLAGARGGRSALVALVDGPEPGPADVVAVGGLALTTGALIWDLGQAVVTNEIAGDSSGPAVPEEPVGTDPSHGNKGRITSGPLAPTHGGTGDPDKDFDVLTGGISAPPPTGSSYPEGSRIGGNGIQIRPGKAGQGPRIDIPGVRGKKPETLHYPVQ